MAAVLHLISFAIGASGLVIGGGIISWQALQWLRNGYWISITVQDAFDWLGVSAPVFQWVGVERIVQFLLASPSSIAIIVVFLVVAGFVFFLAADQERYDHEIYSAKLDAEIAQLKRSRNEEK
jgi:hypothetical protein